MAAPRLPASVMQDDDAQLALWMMYELSYRGFDDAVEVEWDTRLIRLRQMIEQRFVAELHARVDVPRPEADLGQQVLDLAADARGPSLALYLQHDASAEQMRDYLRERSIQRLKESDAYSFVLGRLEGPAKVALAQLQYDEYGGGYPERLQSRLYAQAMTATGLNPTYGIYIDQVGAATLASTNAVSLFAMNRRHVGAAMGHLAAFEASSSVPCRRIATGMLRLGMAEAAAAYFAEHMEADAVHEQVAARDICAQMDADPNDILFGAVTCLFLEAEVARDMLDRWHIRLREAS